MTRTPPKPPLVHRLETRRAEQPVSKRYKFGSDDVGPMFWAAVVVGLVLAIGIVTCGGPT